MLKAFFVDLWSRLWKSYRSTFLGLLVVAVGEALAYFGSAAGVPPYVHALIALASAPFLAWKDKAVAAGTIKLLVCLICFGSLAARADVVQALPEVAASDAPTPSRFGGCVGPWACFQPSVVVTPLAINLRAKKVEAGFTPGVGYGVTFHKGEWYAFGFDAYFNVSTAGGGVAAIAVMGKAANGYLRFGWSKGFIGDSDATAPRLLFGIGSDL